MWSYALGRREFQLLANIIINFGLNEIKQNLKAWNLWLKDFLFLNYPLGNLNQFFKFRNFISAIRIVNWYSLNISVLTFEFAKQKNKTITQNNKNKSKKNLRVK